MLLRGAIRDKLLPSYAHSLFAIMNDICCENLNVLLLPVHTHTGVTGSLGTGEKLVWSVARVMMRKRRRRCKNNHSGSCLFSGVFFFQFGIRENYGKSKFCKKEHLNNANIVDHKE